MRSPRLSFLFAFLLLALTAWAADEQPKITSIRGRVVTVTVPAGFDSVSLQKIRAILRPRGRVERVWGTLDTQFPAASATTLTFRLTKLTPRRNLRVLGSRSAPLPSNFFSGVTSFGADTLSLSNAGSANRAGDDVASAGIAGTANLSASGTTGGSAPVAVVESDIWKIAGDRLYFFNQLRGLQVIDIRKPDAPALLGTLRMPAAGEDLYVVDENHVALLKRGSDFGWGLRGILRAANVDTLTLAGGASPATTLQPYTEAGRENELIIADVSAGAPRQVASVAFKGALRESRLVGHVLYVAASTSLDEAGNYQYGTQVTAFDLSDPAHPATRDSVFIPGWTSAVAATPHYFLVAGYSTVQLVDISAGDGTLKLAGSVTAEGYIADKFKLNVDGAVLTVLSQVWLPWTWDANGTVITRGGVQTVLQTFSLNDPDRPVVLGRLMIAPGESLRATRFDGSRVYVVTFEQIDPLHVVDLSDPANPTVSGEVEAPGFSTYIEPLGDRLVTIGLVDWKPAVSLFDVSNPAAPALLQQVILGGRKDGWSHSEAVWNEKAFKVLAHENLILLPVSGVDRVETDQWGGEWFSRVQLIDLKHDSLAVRGTISAAFSPRRADVIHANRIAAISPSKLVIVNAGNRDEPKVTAEVELAWSVDRVFRIGDYLVQVGGPVDWTGKPAPTLSVAPASDPDAAINVADLDPLEVVGSTLRNGTLFLAQRAWPRWWLSTAAQDQLKLLVTAYDVSALPALKKLSQSSGPAPADSWGQLTALWPSPGTLVWAADGHYVDFATAAGNGVPVAAATRIANFYRPWWGGFTKQFISFKVGAPEKIAYGMTVELKPASGSIFSVPFAQAGLVFISEQKLLDDSTDTGASEAGKHFLRVIDYAEPSAPFIRSARVNLPGRLAGVARDGKLLYTVGSDFSSETTVAKNGAALHASAFDGAAAHLIASQPLPSIWSPVGFSGANVLILDEQPAQLWTPYVLDGGQTLDLAVSRPGFWWGGNYADNPLRSALHIATLTDAGAFTELGTLELAHDSSLRLFGNLAVTQPDWRSIRAIDINDPRAPSDLGAFTLPGNVWLNLDGADGALGIGLWIPVGAYGVETLGLGD
ncbi:MAG: beta-propeller domain-containing protein [Chthoniobacteraceae bacterium]